jgi:nitroreductase
MDVFETIKERRSVRSFEPSHKMSMKELDLLLETAAMSPTAFNIQNWRLVIIKDDSLRHQLSEAAYNQPQILSASLIMVICADMKAWNKDPKRYWTHVEPALSDETIMNMTNYYSGNPLVQRDEAFRSCGMIAQTLMLAAKGIGYDSCPMSGFDFDKAGKIICLPEDHIVVMILAIGKPKEAPLERGGKIPLSQIAFTDHF